MNTSMIQSTSTFENGMNIHLMSFALPKSIIKDNDLIRVSITSVQDGKKQSFTLEGKNISTSNHVFSLNMTNETQRIIIVFRKKNFFSDNPIIASATINLAEYIDIPDQQITDGITTTDIKSINIYYPLNLQKLEENKNNVQRKVLGQMKIQLSFLAPFSMEKQSQQRFDKNNISKTKKSNNVQKKKHDKKRNYTKL